MNKIRIASYILVGNIMAYACVPTPQSSSGGKASLSYSEDLSEYRPKPENLEEKRAATPFRETSEDYLAKSDVTGLLNAKLDTLAENNKAIRSVSGLTIQIYSGSSSDLAYQARDTAITVLPEIRTRVEYNQPIYKVRVGKFTEKLEAQRTLLKLKPKFPNAISVPTTIYIN
ncbi:hypothetical protein GCM10027429_07490 [Marivirga atlantica]|jgi:hypothetical protein|uniref:SPOR domain-containing protein n=1 Tax=Marivirga atlantica TaxID=1548457 RepID=A0A937DJ02_9BACT|nr:SPOR domain-containing protein [Marivirga atlantica]MBL0764359.1 SPOR domain-containing protein [Marivirga atlantica]